MDSIRIFRHLLLFCIFVLVAFGQSSSLTSTTINILFYGGDPNLLGSIVDADPEAITIALAYQPRSNASNSGHDTNTSVDMTVIQGPSTFSMSQSIKGQVTTQNQFNSLASAATQTRSHSIFGATVIKVECKMENYTNNGTCTQGLLWSKTESEERTLNYEQTGLEAYYKPVTITAGLEKLNQVPPATSASTTAEVTASPGQSATAVEASGSSSSAATGAGAGGVATALHGSTTAAILTTSICFFLAIFL